MQKCKEMKTECLLIIQMPRTAWLWIPCRGIFTDRYCRNSKLEIMCIVSTARFWVNCLCCQGCYSQVHECEDTRLVRSLQGSQVHPDEASLVVEGQQSLQSTGGHQEPYRYSTVVHFSWCQDQGFNYRWGSPTLGWVREGGNSCVLK